MHSTRQTTFTASWLIGISIFISTIGLTACSESPDQQSTNPSSDDTHARMESMKQQFTACIKKHAAPTQNSSAGGISNATLNSQADTICATQMMSHCRSILEPLQCQAALNAAKGKQ